MHVSFTSLSTVFQSYQADGGIDKEKLCGGASFSVWRMSLLICISYSELELNRLHCQGSKTQSSTGMLPSRVLRNIKNSQICLNFDPRLTSFAMYMLLSSYYLNLVDIKCMFQIFS